VTGGETTRKGKGRCIYLAELGGGRDIALEAFEKRAGVGEEWAVGSTAATLRNVLDACLGRGGRGHLHSDGRGAAGR
jgi:hypothetical protein